MKAPVLQLIISMMMRWLVSLLCVSFGLVTLAVLELSKRPLCIDSKVVERIDRASQTKVESVFRCSVHRMVPYSEFFGAQDKILSARIQKTERILEAMEPFQRKVQIMIRTDAPLLFKIRDHQILIGEQILSQPGHLERALAKVWFGEKNETFFSQVDLLEEVVADFVLFLQAGGSMYESTLLRWPQVIQSVASYCESDWKKAEDQFTCSHPSLAEAELVDRVTELSLKPLLVNAWIEAFKGLDSQSRTQFLKKFSSFLKSPREPYLPVTDLRKIENTDRMTLSLASTALSTMHSFVVNSSTLKSSDAYKFFASNLTRSLQQKGLQDSFAQAYFDILYISKTPLKSGSPQFHQFEKLAQENPQLQFAVQDGENLWMLPSRHPMGLKSFGSIHSQRTIIEKCGGYDMTDLLGFSDRTEKLLVVNKCDSNKVLFLSEYLKSGAEGFAGENKEVTFVQFHIPSLLMKKQQLQGVANVLDLIEKRDLNSTTFQSLGWQEIQWSKQVNAYRPKAYVDAIEWFRVIN